MKQILAFTFFILYSTTCIAKVIVLGLTEPIDIQDIEKQSVRTQKEAEWVAIALTNKLHAAGYTTSYVARYEFADNECFLYVVESRIADIKVEAGKELKAAIMKDLKTLISTVYNKHIVHQLLQQIQKKYLLDSIRVNVVNYNNTVDVLLVVHVSAKTLMYSFEVSTVPVYGITPILMLSKPIHNAVITASGNIGFNEEMITQKKGKLEFLRYQDYFGWHMGFVANQEYAEWERYATSFTLTAIQPFLGAGILTVLDKYDVSLFVYGNALYYKLSDIKIASGNSHLTQTLSTAGLEMRLRITDQNRTIAKKSRQSTLSLFSCFSEKETAIASRLSFYFPVQLSHRLYVIPLGYSFYTTSSNRVFWEYVYDSYLLGYPKRYTSTQSRHIAGFECMYELIYEMLFCSVFSNSGLYNDEYGQWNKTSNFGLTCDLYYHRVIATLGCAWNIDEKFNRYYIFTGLQSSW